MDKTAIIEYYENIYGYVSNYLRNHKDERLQKLLFVLEQLEDDYKKCESSKQSLILENHLQKIIDEMELIINE